MVAAATTTLCDAANAAVQGNASEERLVAGAKQVSNSTAQLLLACRVKADSNSVTQRRLQVCDRTLRQNEVYSLKGLLNFFFSICFCEVPQQSIIFFVNLFVFNFRHR